MVASINVYCLFVCIVDSLSWKRIQIWCPNKQLLLAHCSYHHDCNLRSYCVTALAMAKTVLFISFSHEGSTSYLSSQSRNLWHSRYVTICENINLDSRTIATLMPYFSSLRYFGWLLAILQHFAVLWLTFCCTSATILWWFAFAVLWLVISVACSISHVNVSGGD